MFIICFDYILSIARLSLYLHISSYSAHSKVPWVGGQYCVSVVLICCLPADTPYILGYVVDHGCDTSIESFVVHSPFVEQVERGCEGRQRSILDLP